MVAAATLLIGAVALPLWRPLLIAAVLAGVLSPLYEEVVRRMRRPALARGRAVHRRDRVPDPDSARRCSRRSPSTRRARRDRPRAQDDRDRGRRRPDREGTRPDRRLCCTGWRSCCRPRSIARRRSSRGGRPLGAGRDVGRARGPGALRLAAGADVDRALLPAARRPRAGRLVHRRDAAAAGARAHDDARIPHRRALGAGRELHHRRRAGGCRHDRLLHRAGAQPDLLRPAHAVRVADPIGGNGAGDVARGRAAAAARPPVGGAVPRALGRARRRPDRQPAAADADPRPRAAARRAGLLLADRRDQRVRRRGSVPRSARAGLLPGRRACHGARSAKV